MDFYSIFQRKKTVFIFVLFVALACIASSPLSFQNWFRGGDSIIHLIRSNDVCYEIGIGNYYPRWLSQACFGKGLPTLNFYPPLFYLIVGYLHAAGVQIITAMVLVCVCSFFVSGWGMYLWTRKYCGEAGALIAATIYIFAPYHLVDIYMRGALPEFVALAILPFLFHGIDLSFSSESSLRGIVCTGLASAAIVLTHNLSAVMILPFALCYFVFCYYYYHASSRTCLLAVLGPLLGLGLSSFYWLPVVLEKKYLVGTGVSIVGSLHYSRHFNTISGFFGSSGQDVFRFNPLYGVLFLSAAVSATAVITCKDRIRAFGLLALTFCFVTVVMTLPISTPVYEAIPALQYLQFPYRFLGPATLFLSAFCGFVPTSKLLRGRKSIALLSLCLLVASCLFLSAGLRKVEGPLPYFPPHPVAFSQNTYPIFLSWSDSDFMPTYSNLSRGDVVQFPVLSNSNMEAPVNDYHTLGSKLSCRVALQQESDLIGLWLYFPGWKAKCDNEELPLHPDKNGLIAVTVPAGVHDIEIRFGTTPPRVAGWILSGITFLTLISCLSLTCIRDRGKKDLGAQR